MSDKNYKAISLFTGAGGLDIGLERAGFSIAACNEIEPIMCTTLRNNFSDAHVIEASVQNLQGEDILKQINLKKGAVDVVAGGPPCQAFSVFGKRRGMEDPRGAVIYDYVRLVSQLKPKVFLMENVRGLLSTALSKEKGAPLLFHDLLKEFGKQGYSVDCYVVNAVNYGAPQIRERVLLIGNRFGLKSNFPKRTHSNIPSEGLEPFATLQAAFRGLSEDNPELMDFSPRKKKYLSMVPSGGNWRSLPVSIQQESMGKAWYLKGGRSAYWRRLSFDFPSPTVVTMPNHASTSMCHPQEIRALSVREYARIQQFPDSWQFAGTTQEKYKQIGNAVPTKLGEVAGMALQDLLNRIAKKEKRDHKNPEFRMIQIRPHVRTRQYYKAGTVKGVIAYGANTNTFYEETPIILE